MKTWLRDCEELLIMSIREAAAARGAGDAARGAGDAARGAADAARETGDAAPKVTHGEAAAVARKTENLARNMT